MILNIIDILNPIAGKAISDISRVPNRAVSNNIIVRNPEICNNRLLSISFSRNIPDDATCRHQSPEITDGLCTFCLWIDIMVLLKEGTHEDGSSLLGTYIAEDAQEEQPYILLFE